MNDLSRVELFSDAVEQIRKRNFIDDCRMLLQQLGDIGAA
jgi:hypothetical protein